QSGLRSFRPYQRQILGHLVALVVHGNYDRKNNLLQARSRSRCKRLPTESAVPRVFIQRVHVSLITHTTERNRYRATSTLSIRLISGGNHRRLMLAAANLPVMDDRNENGRRWLHDA